MRHNIYCSTGCLLSMANKRDWRLLEGWHEKIRCDGFEFLFLDTFEGHFGEIADDLRRIGLKIPVVHLDKDIGTLLSDGEESRALEMLRAECELASRLGSSLAVLHLWGGYTSDRRFYNRNVKACGRITDIADDFGMTIAVENVPCSAEDPLTHWKTLMEDFPKLRFIFDTRFAALHGQIYDFASSDGISDGRVVHMHISDFTGPRMSFRALRPVLHPGEGIIDFERYFSLINGRYAGSVTLESPVVAADGSVDIGRLNRSLDYLRDRLDN
ncbi:MAG: sugar phosphate isomerase/epimerase [Clostridiales bacterium]|nr:sugar phosphate isomerase/epimerase [Clostridiales bacterium]